MFEKVIGFFGGIVDAFENLRTTKVDDENELKVSSNESTDCFPKVNVSNTKIPKTKKEFDRMKKEEKER